MDQVNIEKSSHKFFERFLDNDLIALDNYLHGVYHAMRLNWWFGDPSLEDVGMQSDVTKRYNIFTFDNKEIKKLKESIVEMVKEASEYYGYDYNHQDYKITGWFNLWKNLGVTPIENKQWHFHDKVGAPHFHGYYSINAEPSITHYRIFGKEFNNINKNNRVILSETGHEHAPGDWVENFDRITLAFDIMPAKHIGWEDVSKWITL
jgi:hypothetical protein